MTLLRFFEVLQAQKSWQIKIYWSRNMIKLTNSWSRSRQTVRICQKCHVSTDFLISIKTNWDFSILIETSQSSKQAFWKCRDFLYCQDQLSASVEIESLNRDTIKTNWDPQAYLFHSIKSFCVPFFSRLKNFSFWSVDQKFYFQ